MKNNNLKALENFEDKNWFLFFFLCTSRHSWFCFETLTLLYRTLSPLILNVNYVINRVLLTDWGDSQLVGDACPCWFGYSTRVLWKQTGVGVITCFVFFSLVVIMLTLLVRVHSNCISGVFSFFIFIFL